MARDDLHFRLRIPDALKARVKSAADANHRSVTSEIIARLEASFDEPATMPAGELPALIKSIVEQVLETQQEAAAKSRK